jgi:D-cysteine desulfhydrase
MPDAASRPALFEVFPQLASALPWTPLGEFPTPVARLAQLGCENLWIKRDDMSSRVYGGNKVRKLEFILGRALSRGQPRLVTMGAIGTHHGLATATFGRALGIACTLLLFPQPVTERVRDTLRLLHRQGADLVYRPSLWRTLAAYYLEMRLRRPGAAFVFAGGSDPPGALGFVSAAFELKRQIEGGELPEPAVIVCPFGSGGTLAGLALGAAHAGLAGRVVGVRVTAARLGPFAAATPGSVLSLMRRTQALLRRSAPGVPDLKLRPPEVIDDYFGAGYGVPTAGGRRALELLKSREGIVLEETYTAKTVAAVLDLCRRSAPGTPVLYWHTCAGQDFSAEAASVDWRRLPAAFHRFFRERKE